MYTAEKISTVQELELLVPHCFQYCIMPREDTSSPATPLSWNTKAGPIIRFSMALIAKASVLDSQLDFDRNT